MSTRDDRDDDRPDPRHSRNNNNNVVLVVLLVLFGLVVVCGGGAVAFLWTAKVNVQEAARDEARQQEERARKLYTRDELKAAVVGKTMEEVRAMLGVPESTRDAGGADVWRYEGVSRDPVTGKTDTSASIFFVDGKVTKILF